MSKLFGTDGIRGIANRDLSPKLAMQVGSALASILIKKYGRKICVVVGRDTRVSSSMLESAIAAGITSGGVDVKLVGIVPTPLISYMCKVSEFSAGVMISASHNLFEYNGIKIFGTDGTKLSDELEQQIEDIVLGNLGICVAPDGAAVGSISRVASPTESYVNYISSLVEFKNPERLKILVDCANGSTYATARSLFSKLNINAEFISDSPNGTNINSDCGSTHIDRLAYMVVEGSYDLALAFDGDGDRCLAMDENGQVIDGDIMLAIFANHMKKKSKLAENSVVITIMSNYGFDAFCEKNAIENIKTKVGDKFVLEAMLEKNLSLGGEQSGHIIFVEHMTTGDGELTALKLIEVLLDSGKTLSELAKVIEIYPQVLINSPATPIMKTNLFESIEFNKLLRTYENELGSTGRILVRPSGTEPIIRVMVEGKSYDDIQKIANALDAAVRTMLV